MKYLLFFSIISYITNGLPYGVQNFVTPMVNTIFLLPKIITPGIIDPDQAGHTEDTPVAEAIVRIIGDKVDPGRDLREVENRCIFRRELKYLS